MIKEWHVSLVYLASLSTQMRGTQKNKHYRNLVVQPQIEPPNCSSSAAGLQSVFSDVSRLANTKQLGVSRSLKQYSVMVPCRTVITNSLSDGWTLLCRMSDKWLLCTNHSTFIRGKRKKVGIFAPKQARSAGWALQPAAKCHTPTSNTFNIIARTQRPILKLKDG